jgi:hypothetical protein
MRAKDSRSHAGSERQKSVRMVDILKAEEIDFEELARLCNLRWPILRNEGPSSMNDCW